MKSIVKCLALTLALLTSSLTIAATDHKVLLVIVPGCKYCSEAENILDNDGIKYETSISTGGSVPRLFVDGHYEGTGVEAVQSWADANK